MALREGWKGHDDDILFIAEYVLDFASRLFAEAISSRTLASVKPLRDPELYRQILPSYTAVDIHNCWAAQRIGAVLQLAQMRSESSAHECCRTLVCAVEGVCCTALHCSTLHCAAQAEQHVSEGWQADVRPGMAQRDRWVSWKGQAANQ